MLSSLKKRLTNQFNVAVAEVDYQDKWQRALLAVVTVGVDGRSADSTCDKVVKHLERDQRISILECTREIR